MFAMGFAMCRLLDPYTPGGEPIHNGSRLVSLPRNHTHQDRLRYDFERTHTHLRPLGDFTTSRSALARAPPDHSYRDLGILHSRCDQLSLALVESCWGGRSPVIASPRVSPPSDALSSTSRFVIPQDRHRPRDASSDLAIEVAFQAALSRTIRSWRPI